MTSPKQLVFLVGATGRTGASIARALAKHPDRFEVKAIVRPSSVGKPIIEELESLRVKIVTGDIVDDAQETLEDHLKGVDTAIITTLPFEEGQQDKLLRAAKAARVKRVIPSDFASYAPPGSMQYQDMKVRTQKSIIENDIPYIFIQVGVWPDAVFPLPHSVDSKSFFQKQFHGPGDVKTSWTALERVGEFVARIISDPRTLNHTVQTWDGETTQGEMYALASRLTGENYDDYHKLSLDEIESRCGKDLMSSIGPEYSRSVWFRGENTIENAVAAGALDARALYPDYKPLPLEEWARGFYSKHGTQVN
ncbi:hypothetical protein AAF712_015487 [Marasmius tenuissimus]|uniref:NmrA-like domain-containing protein n=1 Tax=Marasmius tenuissimus TaxID=585030 RepID=A0ABR2Z970_9AGAR